MKKATFAILVLAALAFGLASCDNETTSGAGGASWNPVGTWKCVSSTYYGGVPPYDDRIEFKKDGTFEWIQSKPTDRGTYKYDNEEIILDATWNIDSHPGIKILRYDSTAKELVWQNSNDTRRYAKQ